MTDLPGHDGKVTSDKKLISISHQRCKGENRDYCSHFLMTFETTGKFLLVFVGLILGKKGLTDLSGDDRKVIPDMNLI